MLNKVEPNLEVPEDSDELLSVCCGVSAYIDSDCDICPDCKEHTDFLTEKELEEV